MLLTDTHKSAWNAFVAAFPTGDFQQAWEWGDLKARTAWRPWRLALREGDTIVAGMQILQRRAPGGRSLFYAPRGPLVAPERPDLLQAVMAEARELARRERALALKVDPALPAPNETFEAALRGPGFRPAPGLTEFGGVQPRYVMKVDITPDPDALLASFHPKWRYNIRLAERKGVQIRVGTRDELPAFYEVLQETCARDGFSVRSIDYYYDLYDLVLQAGLGALFLGSVEDELICGAITLAMGRQACYVYGASSNRRRNTMPNHLLQWEMMQWAKARGCSVYDMRGVAREAPGEHDEGGLHGLNRFKRGFGAAYLEYVGEYDLVYSPLWYAAYNTALSVRAALRHRSQRPPETSD
jgi:lipid II:glycine glycyltransferase (peptidoglycan interpeptide bridge formation enzyme)